MYVCVNSFIRDDTGRARHTFVFLSHVDAMRRKTTATGTGTAKKPGTDPRVMCAKFASANAELARANTKVRVMDDGSRSSDLRVCLGRARLTVVVQSNRRDTAWFRGDYTRMEI